MPRTERLLQLLDKSPRDDFLLYGLAIEHAKSGEHETALQYFDRAIEANRDNPYHYYHKAKSLEALERIDEALGTLRAGAAVAQEADDAKAVGEIRGYIDMIRINWPGQ
ncbi:MAG TPA: CDC27 family protein [Phycisphaerales bacterium]|nr:CDC27 family protein [Phycisphaerales bacterium]